MIEREYLTGNSRSRYTGGMNEGAVGVAERPTVTNQSLRSALEDWKAQQAQAPEGETVPFVMPKSGYEKLLEEKEKEIIANRVEKPLNLPKDVVKENKFEDGPNWEKFGWSNEESRDLESKMQDVLVIGDKYVKNLMQIFLASGQKPDELLKGFDKALEDARQDVERREDSYRGDKYSAIQKNFLYRLGLNKPRQQEYLERFVFTEQNREALTAEIKRDRPDNLYDLAWQISFSDQDHEKLFGVNGDYPMLQMRVDTDEYGNVTDGRYAIHQGNFIRWERERIVHWQDQEPDDYVEYMSKIQLKKDYSPVSLGDMLNDHQLYFTDETGQYYGELFKEALIEPWLLGNIRKMHIVYKSIRSSDKQIVEKLGELFAKNPLTKKTYGKNLTYYMMTMPLDFEGDVDKRDATMGAAVNMMMLAMYNLSDFEGLQHVLGEDSSFFTRDGFRKAIDAELGGKSKETGVTSQQMATFMGEGLADFQKAFGIEVDDKGNITDEGKNEVVNKDAFSKFVNHYFSAMGPNKNQTDVIIKGALKNAVKEQLDFQSKHDTRDDADKKIDEYSLDVAFLIAEANSLWTGIGARNDTGAAGFDAMSKMRNSRIYRMKMATPERGNGMGNPATVNQFKMLVVDYLQATRVSESYIVKDGKKTKETKTQIQVMEEMLFIEKHHESVRKQLREVINNPQTSAELRASKQKELDSLNTAASYAYKQIAGQLEFKDNAMVNYVSNHLARGQKLYEQVMSNSELKFDECVKMDPLTHHISIDRAKFQKMLQEDLLKNLRYLISTYGELNLNDMVRSPVFAGRGKDGKDKWVYKTMPLGEAMFGYDMLNIPEFRKRKKVLGKDGKPKKVMNKETGKEEIVEGGYIKRADGRYEIDYDKVNNKKDMVWKQMALTKIGTDLLAHMNIHSKEAQYSASYYAELIEAIQSIPSEVLGDEMNMSHINFKSEVFSHDQIKWFKKKSKTTFFRLARMAFRHDRKLHEKENATTQSLAMLVSAIFRGY